MGTLKPHPFEPTIPPSFVTPKHTVGPFQVFEDEQAVHIVMEYCRGGELIHRIGLRHYSERTVASYMRAVLRTLMQCHALRILHRDIKPGNFMLLNESDTAPLKAIGAAAPHDVSAVDVPFLCCVLLIISVSVILSH